MIALKRIYYYLPRTIQNYLNTMAFNISNNTEEDFINNDIYGKHYNLKKKDRELIVKRIRYCLSKILSATNLNVQLHLIKNVLALPKEDKNVLVECGSYKGASSVALSIAAKITNRKLIIYDSFEGLPDDESGPDNKREYPHLKIKGHYESGMYSGTLDEVEQNLKNYGEREFCIIRSGFFNKSLTNHKEKIDLLFLDVDLLTSTKDCIKYLWSHVKDNGYIYTDDSCDLKVVRIWFDKEWWLKNLNQDPPGYIGSGCGINIDKEFSSLGYTIKNPDQNGHNEIDWLKN